MEWMILPLKRYADFSGRSRRMEYWLWVVLQFIVYVAFAMLTALLGGAMAMIDEGAGAIGAGIVSLLYLLWWLGSFVPNLAVTVRRLHDSGRSGWWVLGPILPFLIMIIAVFGAEAWEGSPGETVPMAVIIVVSFLAAFAFWLLLVVFLFLEGTRGSNRYGPDPKQPTPAEIFA